MKRRIKDWLNSTCKIWTFCSVTIIYPCKMIKREIQDIVLNSLKNYPIVGILGSRQVGKTTLAKAVKEIAKPEAVYLDLELPSDLNKLQNAELYLKQFEKALVIIDEIQRMPSLFPLLRPLVD
jgi:uncharacterized protein